MKKSIAILLAVLMLTLSTLPIIAKEGDRPNGPGPSNGRRWETFKVIYDIGSYIPTYYEYLSKDWYGTLNLVRTIEGTDVIQAFYEGWVYQRQANNYNKVEVKTVGENSRIIVNDDDLAINGNIVIDMRK
ncbi:MAG: hypothetical protein SOZ40_00725 [Ezakiella sp.]|nr:hypothetical protein [Ezakiella sp.]MDD7761685.1 hypothetical protein [Bacillota bacterium]MDY3946509.1 hypothetical protein [Ezakiella sp.]